MNLHPRLRDHLLAFGLDEHTPPSPEIWQDLLLVMSAAYEAPTPAEAEDAVFIFSLEGRLIDVNERGVALLDVPKEEIVGAEMGKFVAAPERGDQQDRLAMLLEGRVVPPYVRYFIRPDGARIPGEVSISLIRNARGEPKAVRSQVRDLRKRAPSKEYLISEWHFLNTLIDALPEQVYAKDRYRRYIVCNRAHARALGAASPNEVLGRTKRDFFPDAVVSRFDDEDDYVFQTGMPMLNIETMSVRGEESRWYTVSKLPLRDADGVIIGLVGVVQDVTSFKQMQHQLAESRDQALETARLKTEFLATMSHEIRTPMSSVLGMIELLRLTPLNEEQIEYAQIIDTEAQHLLRIINDILDFSKIEAGRVVLDSVPMRFADVLKSVVDLYTGRVREKGLELVWEVDPTLPAVRGDPGRLRQILLNLVDNAIKFTASGEIGIALQTLRLEPGALVVRCLVRDSGIGIPAKVIKRLFQPFTQADGSTTRRFGGTGLGLAIVRGLVEAMGGQIGVESIEGEGSVFWFTARFELATDVVDLAPPAALGAPDPNNKHLRILIVEDDPNHRQLALDMVTYFGYSVDVVTSGEEAVLAYSQNARVRYNLILMDCLMPYVDGFEATRRIRALEAKQREHVPIIAMTVLIQPETRIICMEAGMDDYITKPVPMHELQRVIARWLPKLQG